MAKSKNEYTGDGVQDVFSVNFEYLRRSYVHVSVDGVNVAFSWNSDTTVKTDVVPADQSVVKVYRETPSASIGVFLGGNLLSQKELNTIYVQALHNLEEHVDA